MSRGGPSSRTVVLALVVVLVAGVLVWVFVGTRSGDKDPPPTAAPASVSELSATMLPPISQRSARPASAGKAGAVVQVDAPAESAGADVTLQVRRMGTWSDEGTAALDRSGRAAFPAPEPDGDENTLVRVVASQDRSVRSARLGQDDWKLAFEDQFAGDELDQTKWGYRQLGLLSKKSGRGRSESSKKSVDVEKGALRLSTLKNRKRAGYYLNGHIGTDTTYSFTYGVSAARIKFQKPRGMHGAFWMQSPLFASQPGNPEASGAEIDAAEYFGSTYPDGGLASFIYYLGADGKSVKFGGMRPRATESLAAGDAWWKKYHVFSVEWTPEHYVYRIDGEESLRLTRGISGSPQFLVLSMLSSDWELKSLDESKLPGTMKVDWVRVWQQPEP